MSLMRQRASKLRQTASLRRGKWKPDPHSTTYAMYRYWQRKSHAYVAQENFCHYWRAVLLYAPVYWLKKPVKVMLKAIALLVLGAALVFYAIELYRKPWILVFAVTVLALLRYAKFCVEIFREKRYEKGRGYRRVDWVYRLNRPVKVLVYIAALPTLLVYYAAYAPVMYLHDKRVASRSARVIARGLFLVHLGDEGWLTWLRPWLLLPMVLLVLSVVPNPAQTASSWTLGIISFIALVITALLLIGKAENDRRAAEEVRLPEPKPVRPRIVQKKTPRRQNRFIRGAVDLLALCWAAIETKKWRICPIVELPEP